MRKSVTKNIIALFIGCFLALIVLEIALRLLNPMPSRIKGDKIILPINQEYNYSNNGIKGVDSIVNHKKNSLGFRGSELPSVDINRLKLLFVGGSTTECTACKDGDDWPLVSSSILGSEQYWINNAGLDGHSTYGHLILVKDYLIKLKPDYIAFLVGVNDMGRTDLSKFENFHLLKDNSNFMKRSIYKSSIVQLFQGWRAKKMAQELELGHKNIQFQNWEHIEQDNKTLFEFIQNEEPLLENYASRIDALGQLCVKNGIKPIFITQPTVMGGGYDSITHVDFNTIKIREYSGQNFNVILNLYNDVLRSYCNRNDYICIDLWQLLDKNSNYFYDEVHFTKLGSRKVGEIVSKSLEPLIEK